MLDLLLSFVLHRIKEQTLVGFEDGQDGLSAHRRPAAEDHGYFVLENQFLGFLSEKVPVGRRIDNNRLDLLAQDPALGVNLVNGHKDDVLE